MRKVLGLLFVISFCILCLFYFWAHRSTGNTSIKGVKEYEVTSTKDALNDTLSIMSYNIGYLSGMTNNQALKRDSLLFLNNFNKAINLISTINPDIIGFQEIDYNSTRSWNKNQSDLIAKKTGFPFVYNTINWDKNYVPFPYWPISTHFGKMLSGQSIFSKYPISAEYDVSLIEPTNAPFYYQDFYLDRMIQKVSIKIDETEIIIMNVHLEAFDVDTRQMHLARVKTEYLKYEKDYPVILIGDFNSNLTDIEPGLNSLLDSEDLVSSYGFYAEESMKTYSSVEPVLLLDYIFYNSNFIEKIDSRIVAEAGEISDHLPIMMRFRLKKKNAQETSR